MPKSNAGIIGPPNRRLDHWNIVILPPCPSPDPRARAVESAWTEWVESVELVPMMTRVGVPNVEGGVLMTATAHKRSFPAPSAPVPPPWLPGPHDEEEVLVLSERPLRAEVRRPGLLGAARHVPAPQGERRLRRLWRVWQEMLSDGNLPAGQGQPGARLQPLWGH